MATKTFAFEEQFKMYVEELSGNEFLSFPKFDLIERENIIFFF